MDQIAAVFLMPRQSWLTPPQAATPRTMRPHRRILGVAVLLAPFVALGQSPVTPPTSVSVAIDVHQDALAVQPIGGNWPSYNGNYSGQRYSGLAGINAQNVSALRAQWVFHAPN
jgi:alcohol dehydrogenase (cytochrome c)